MSPKATEGVGSTGPGLPLRPDATQYFEQRTLTLYARQPFGLQAISPSRG